MNILCSLFSLTLPASMQIYWNKRKRLQKSSTPTGLVWDANMAAVSLFWDTNMAAMTSCENTQLISFSELQDEEINALQLTL